MNETHRQDCAFDLRSFVCEFFFDLHQSSNGNLWRIQGCTEAAEARPARQSRISVFRNAGSLISPEAG